MSAKLAERLQAALSAEHSAIFAYGRFGVLLDKAAQKEARAGRGAHRTRRDALRGAARRAEGGRAAGRRPATRCRSR